MKKNPVLPAMNQLEEVLEAREMANWASKVEMHPGQYTLPEQKYARAILHYHDKWRAVVHAHQNLAALCKE